LQEVTSVSEECHCQFFLVYLHWGSSSFYEEFVVAPSHNEEAMVHMREFTEAGINGCIGSLDSTNVGMLRCQYARWNQHKGPKESLPARNYNITDNHKRQIIKLHMVTQPD
jgi:hypothetical protein